MINTIILDIGNVLASFDYLNYLEEKDLSDELIKRLCKATVENILWREIDRSDSDIMDEILISGFIAEDPEIADEIRTFLMNSYEIVKEYDYASDFVRALKKAGYPVYLLSNYGKANFKYAKDNFEFFKYVDGGVISYETGYVKPEVGIFEAFVKRYEIKPEEAVFLDDIEANVKAASDFGFHTIHFNNINQAIEELQLLGVKID
ncbi:MAG: HAD family phosphatase [Anaerolineaceae bacterium]|nr:MAG: HAD family phosphatase [Anaerolineaceae bacterium]